MSDQSERVLTDYDQILTEAFNAYQQFGNENAAAKQLGVNRTTMTNRLLRFFLRGLAGDLPMEPMVGHVIANVSQQFDSDGALKFTSVRTKLAPSEDPFSVPEGHRIKGESALLDPQGNVIQKWVKTAEGDRSDEVIHEAARKAAERYAGPAAPLDFRPWDQDRLDPLLLNLHQLPDLHIGLHSDAVRAEIDWSLESSISIYETLFRSVMERAPKAATGVILGGGDLLHFDDKMKQTRGHGHRLDGAADYSTVLAAAENLMVYKVEMALQRYEKVVVRILEGNHDPDSAIAIAHYLKAWFRAEPRVEVDTDPSVFWFYEFGQVMLAATHGHEAKIDQMPGIMAADRPQMWGRTAFRYAHGFHIHHKTRSAGEDGGAAWETHTTPVPRDDYHQNKQYRSGRLLDMPTYHAERGWKGSTVETLL